MLGVQLADLFYALLAIGLTLVALVGHRINRRCKIHCSWWTHVDGFRKKRESAAFSTPASNVGLGLFGAALIGLYVIALMAALRHHVAESFIFLSLWVPLMVGLFIVVCLPFWLFARWTTRAISGLRQAL